MDRNYWLDLFTGRTWEEFKEHGADVTGFRSTRRQRTQDIQPGDYLLCYLTGLSRFIGVLEVKSGLYEDDTRIWKDAVFPLRFDVDLIYELTAGTAVPVMNLRDKLSIFENLSSPHAWTGFFRGSPALFDPNDGGVITEAIRDAIANPVSRDYDERIYWRRPRTFESTGGKINQTSDAEGTRSREDFLRMSKEEIVDAVIELLQSRPNHSCKSSDLPSQTLRLLGVRTRGAPRQQCEKRIGRIVTGLKRGRIVETYKTSRNRRVRLSADFEERLEQYKKNQEKRVASSLEAEADEPGDYTSEEDRFINDIGLPELPDDDTDDLLGELSGEMEDEVQTPQTLYKKEQTTFAKKRDVLTSLNKILTEEYQLQSESQFRKLILMLSLAKNVQAKVHIGYYGSGYARLVVSSQLPFSSEAMKELLEWCSHPEFVGRLCIETPKGTPNFVIKKELELSRYSDDDVAAVVDEILRQSKEFAEIIESHSYEFE
jgi:hypothetical protein